MKILWLSNKYLATKETGRTGTWLDAMASGLVATGQVELSNLALCIGRGAARQVTKEIRQWLVPTATLCYDGLPPRPVVNDIIEIVRSLVPDLIHVWGTEIYAGLLTARKLRNFPALLEIQGLKEPYARVYAGGLNSTEQRACIGLKEIIKLRSIASGQKAFEKWSSFEREILAGHRFISTQTTWVDAWVRASNTSAQLLHTELLLRGPFYTATQWQAPMAPVIFCSAAYPVPYKGIHDAIRAVALLKRKFPDIRLRIGGAFQSKGIRQEGYMAWVNRLAQKLYIAGQIDWMGPLTATEIVAALQNCSAMLIPTHIENCCTAMQEAMLVGTPVVASRVGGLPSVARDEESALFFPPGDEVMCAYQLERVLTERSLAESLSQHARALASLRNNPDTVINRQLSIYRQVIAEGKT